MSSGNNTNSGNNGNGADKINWQRVASPDLVEQVDNLLEVQIAKFDKQSRRLRDKLMKRAAEQEAQKKAEEERKKAEEEAKRAAEEEARRLAEEEAKKKAEEDAQKRAEFQARWQADLERKAREKAEAKAAVEAMRAQIAQKVGQGEKPKPKPKQRWAVSQHVANEEVQGWYPPCDWCQKSEDEGQVPLRGIGGDDDEVGQQGEMQRERDVSDCGCDVAVRGRKAQEDEEGGGRCDPVAQVLDRRLGEVIAAIDRNTRELARLGGKMDGFAWEMKRMADHSDRKGKGKARPEETEEEEEKSDDVSNADVEGEDADE
ncbi:hypothetical protein SCLCIDRAFT_21713 [Scleroderma citrinum Foug A]|uniref:Uncharacterized protein n=1 Tax=Scleroderma citrinum Foug A TaxID=1036808 RepID=A0A0C2ZZV9_9AGAM|nr:hypothetical protein SCLCIDRAFT_21713 [Scleroderma citrinum Foug A]